MLPKKNRLTTAELKNHRGHRLTTPTLHALTAAAPTTKYAILIKKTLVPKAHARNRLRRLIYAALAPNISTPPFHHTLLILQPQGTKVGDADILNDLNALLSVICKL
jgi:ribonuclease P protein component